MGRPFAGELMAMNDTYDAFLAYSIDEILDFLENSLIQPILCIGSGGSYAVAKAFSLLASTLGCFSKTITPFELLNEKGLNRSNVIIFTAGGNNPDTLNAYKYVKMNETHRHLVVCLNSRSKISKMMECNGDIHNLCIYEIPHGKDGFLAVNSTLGMLTVFQRIYHKINSLDKKISVGFSDDFDVSESFLSKKTIIALSGEWTAPVADDFESKCTEAGLVNVQVANLRNFAHGRHHWIAKNESITAIVCFATEIDRKLLEKTIGLLPSIPVITIMSQQDSIECLIDLFSKMFWLVQKIGLYRNIDPGRPQVPAYGSKIYNISFSLNTRDEEIAIRQKKIHSRALYRKIPIRLLNKSEVNNSYREKLQDYLNAIKSTTFNAVIFDYDNTVIYKNDVSSDAYREIIKIMHELLSNDISIAFATGRGSSIQKQLHAAFKQDYWEKIYIGYYNCNLICRLNTPIVSKESNIPIIGIVHNNLTTNTLLREANIKIKLGVNQISVRCNESQKYWVDSVINEILSAFDINNELKKLASDHSFDIIPISTSKINLYNELINRGLTVLCIGDSGSSSGNDYELLSAPFSLSANSVSLSSNTCWNLAPLGLIGPSATLYYLKCLSLECGRFRINL